MPAATPDRSAGCGRCLPVSRALHDLGAFGNGSRMKFVANLLVAINNVASAEAMVLGLKSGLDAAAGVRDGDNPAPAIRAFSSCARR